MNLYTKNGSLEEENVAIRF